MIDQLLTTKLYIPQTHPNLVPRPRLSERLKEGMGRKLTLISAPAGFGKTTLLSEWRMLHLSREWPLAWVSLDEGDNDPVRFLSYFVAALQMIAEGIGESALASLRSPQPRPIETILTVLVNEVAAIPEEFALVLDDYHVIEAEPVHNAVTFLLAHLPPQIHLVIVSRTDPPLPLARLRARGQMTELRAADLRFTCEEAAAFLNDVMGLDLSAKEIAALEEHTEGWIAGLQLAALSIQGLEDISGFIAAFAGSNRYILDYLTQEVVERQPAQIQAFLLETSILSRLTAGLCDEVVGRGDSQAMLEKLEQANIFVIPLDDKRLWYRYHHLFADMLRYHLHRRQPDRVAELYRRAARWYENHGFADEAIRHALAAGDNETAARLVEQNTETAVMRSEGATLRQWLDALPEELVRNRPKLSVAYAIASLFGGRLGAVEPFLRDAERALSGSPDISKASLSEKETKGWLADIPGCIAIIRGDLARMQGDMSRAAELSQQALARLPKDSLYLRSKAAWNLGITSWMSGNLSAADKAFLEITANDRATGNAYLPLLAVYGLGRLRMIQGRLHEAAKAYRRALRLGTTEEGKPPLPVAAWAYLGMGELLREWNDLDAATRHLLEGLELGKRVGEAGPLATGYTVLARVKQAQGDASGAFDAIEKAREVAPGPNVHHIFHPLAPHWARVWLAQGDLVAAARWLQERGLSVDDELSYLREVEHIVLARLLIAQDKSGGARRLLERLLSAAQAGGRIGSVIEILMLKALALQLEGDAVRAVSTLARALSIAESEGYISIFVDEGAPIAALLSKVLEAQKKVHLAMSPSVSPEYVTKLLAALGVRAAPLGEGSLRRIVGPLLKPLSERELEVLRLIALGLSNREIARELFITPGTAKRHGHNIYRKLEVRSRTQAVARARALNLV